jgi:hypothetical protein
VTAQAALVDGTLEAGVLVPLVPVGLMGLVDDSPPHPNATAAVAALMVPIASRRPTFRPFI